MKVLSASDTDADVPVVEVVLDVSVANVLVVVAVSDVAVSLLLHPNAIRETIAKRKIQLRLMSFHPSVRLAVQEKFQSALYSRRPSAAASFEYSSTVL